MIRKLTPNFSCGSKILAGFTNSSGGRSALPSFLISKRYYPQLPKRFYKEVTVSKNETDGTFGINLDHRKLKTPGKRTFQVKNESLAAAIAQEWASQEQHIQQSFMHLTSLANTVQDNPLHKSKADFVNECVGHLSEDTIIYRVPESNSTLLELQIQKWDPVIRWFESEFKTTVPIIHGSIMAPEIQESSVVNLRRFLSSLSFEAIQGLTFAMGSLRSVILTLAIAKNQLSVREAVDLGRLETTFQTDHWGNVEWAHDLELQETLSRVSAGMLFYSFHTSSDDKNPCL